MSWVARRSIASIRGSLAFSSAVRVRTCQLWQKSLCLLRLVDRNFSTHSFVLDRDVYGKDAFESNNLRAALSPNSLYASLTVSGQVDEDPRQVCVLERLEHVYNTLLLKQHPPSLYIWGPAGSGKSMVMDLFHFCLEENGIRARRQHFHEFLYEMHTKLHQLHLEQRRVPTHEFIRQIANNMGRDLDVLCFDEFAITTIQDCTLLVPLFSQLFSQLALVITSNRHPDNLYEDGLNRHLHLPAFQAVLAKSAEVVTVASTDYREREYYRERVSDDLAKVFFGKGAIDTGLASEFLRKLGLETDTKFELAIGYNRKMLVECCTEDGTAALFAAKKLLGGPPFFSADDYNAICRQFDTVVLDGLWVLDIADHNEAKRLTNFLDCAYELHVRLVCVNMQEVAAEAIFQNLLPLETLSLQEIVNSGREKSSVGSPQQAGISDLDDVSASGSASCQRLASQLSPADNDSFTSSKAQVVRSIQDLPVAASQQSCYYLSEDHKDWSVESKIVQTSARQQSAGVTSSKVSNDGSMTARERVLRGLDGVLQREPDQSGHSKQWVRVSSLGPAPRERMLHEVVDGLPREADQSGRSKHFCDTEQQDANATSFDDASSEQHSVKGVFVAAVASLHETGFAVKRAVSRLREMQTTKYLNAHRDKRRLADRPGRDIIELAVNCNINHNRDNNRHDSSNRRC